MPEFLSEFMGSPSGLVTAPLCDALQFAVELLAFLLAYRRRGVPTPKLNEFAIYMNCPRLRFRLEPAARAYVHLGRTQKRALRALLGKRFFAEYLAPHGLLAVVQLVVVNVGDEPETCVIV
jgi:hypothetical protein